jgi:hypothetical protein
VTSGWCQLPRDSLAHAGVRWYQANRSGSRRRETSLRVRRPRRRRRVRRLWAAATRSTVAGLGRAAWTAVRRLAGRAELRDRHRQHEHREQRHEPLHDHRKCGSAEDISRSAPPRVARSTEGARYCLLCRSVSCLVSPVRHNLVRQVTRPPDPPHAGRKSAPHPHGGREQGVCLTDPDTGSALWRAERGSLLDGWQASTEVARRLRIISPVRGTPSWNAVESGSMAPVEGGRVAVSLPDSFGRRGNSGRESSRRVPWRRRS